MKRAYRVVAQYSNGTYVWNSITSGHLPFSRVSADLVNQWKEYAESQVGHECAIVNFIRIQNP